MGQRGPIKGSRRFGVVKGGSKQSRSSDTRKDTEAPAVKRPTAPKWLPPEGRKLFRTIVADLEAQSLLRTGDGIGLSALVTHYAILVMAVEQLRDAEGKHKISVEDPDHKTESGQAAVRKHPLLSVIANHSEKLKAWATEFALTPAARERLNMQPIRGVSKLEKFLKEG